jgi:hypothetical protein
MPVGGGGVPLLERPGVNWGGACLGAGIRIRPGSAKAGAQEGEEITRGGYSGALGQRPATVAPEVPRARRAFNGAAGQAPRLSSWAEPRAAGEPVPVGFGHAFSESPELLELKEARPKTNAKVRCCPTRPQWEPNPASAHACQGSLPNQSQQRNGIYSDQLIGCKCLQQGLCKPSDQI